jgi:chorismate mutase
MAMNVRAIRGATTLTSDTPLEMTAAVSELISEILSKNEVAHSDLISLFFTATPDLVSTFPATAARALDLGDVPLMCAVEIDVDGALEKTIRVMVHAHSERTLGEIVHVYQRGATVLRRDLAQ